MEGAGGIGRPLAQKLLAAGERVVDVPPKLSSRVRLLSALARYNADGSLDGSFEGGMVVTEMGAWDEAEALAIQADGRIVAAGSAESDDGDYDIAIARYHAITDNTPPNTTITSGPSGAISGTSATFVSSEPGSKFECSLDGAPYSGCSSPKSYSNLTDGSHHFCVRAIDAEGNVDLLTPAQRTFTVDTKAPKVDSVFPAEDATGVGQAVNVKATFSEAMSASSINTTTVQLFRAGTTTPKAAVVSYDTGTKTVTLNPNIDLRLGTKYKAVVTTATRDLAGNQLDQDQDPSNGNQNQVWTFTTNS